MPLIGVARYTAQVSPRGAFALRPENRHHPIMRALLLLLSLSTTALAQGRQGDFIVRDFRFTTGESLPEVKLHYTTLGTPRKDARGVTRNAVMILHGTGGSGRGFLSANFAGELFGPGQMLDTAKFFIVLPDNLGHGGSSKPSDGMRARFPKYTYDDMVEAQRRLLVDGLGVNHLRLVMGTSMGCMHSWMWLTRHPDFMDGSVPLDCAPGPIVGRNRMIRALVIESLKGDPEYRGGDYTAPLRGMRAAQGFLWVMGSAPLLGHVRAPVLHINSADDFVNPPELDNVGPLLKRVPGAQVRAAADHRTDARAWHAFDAGDLGPLHEGLPRGAARALAQRTITEGPARSVAEPSARALRAHGELLRHVAHEES